MNPKDCGGGISVLVRLVGLFASCLKRCGLLVIEGEDRLRNAIREGSVIIASNHPSMLETLFIPVILYPDLLRDHVLMPWSVADRRIVPKMFRWIFPLVRIISIDRSDRDHTAAGLLSMYSVLRKRGAVAIYPEGGRTGKGERFVSAGKRRLRRIEPTVCVIARKMHTAIVPVWIDFDAPMPLGYAAALAWMCAGNRMRITVGNPYCIATAGIREAAEELERRMLHVGAVGP